jgi:hypothetical protein
MEELTKEQLGAEVTAELQHLKENATPEELARLNYDTFIPFSSVNDLYGQMTGNCFSERAKELYPKKYGHLERLKDKKEVFKYNFFVDKFYTPLEYYSSLKKAKNKKIIQYLKGEINSF